MAVLETVLIRTLMVLHSSDHEGDDDHCPQKPGNTRSSARRAFTVLSSVCWDWWHTLSGLPQLPTGRWARHRLRKMIERERTCTRTLCC